MVTTIVIVGRNKDKRYICIDKKISGDRRRILATPFKKRRELLSANVQFIRFIKYSHHNSKNTRPWLVFIFFFFFSFKAKRCDEIRSITIGTSSLMPIYHRVIICENNEFLMRKRY